MKRVPRRARQRHEVAKLADMSSSTTSCRLLSRARTVLLAVACVASLATAPGVAQSTTQDAEWSQWRGSNRDGISHETGLLASWPEGGPARAREIQGLGLGYSSVAATGDTLTTLGARDGREWLMAIDSNSGIIRWRTENGPIFRNDQGDGPRSTPTIRGGVVYAFAANGRLLAAELESGEPVWQVDVTRRFRASTPRWGFSESPLVTDDLVLVNAGGRRASVVALDRKTGETVWQSQGDPAGYSSAIVVEHGGGRQAVFFTHSRALGVRLQDGELLWDYGRAANPTANAATPIFSPEQDLLFVSSDYGTGAGTLELVGDQASGYQVKERYFTSSMRNHHSTSVLSDGVLYGFSSAILTAMRLSDGEILWRDRSVGKGSLILAEDRLYLLSERGTVALAEVSSEAYRELGRFQLPRPQANTWSHPMIHQKQLYLRDQDRLYVFDIEAASDATPSSE